MHGQRRRRYLFRMNEEYQCPPAMALEDPALWDQLRFNYDLTNRTSNATTEQSVEISTIKEPIEGKADNFYFAVSGIILIVCALLATLGISLLS